MLLDDARCDQEGLSYRMTTGDERSSDNQLEDKGITMETSNRASVNDVAMNVTNGMTSSACPLTAGAGLKTGSRQSAQASRQGFGSLRKSPRCWGGLANANSSFGISTNELHCHS